MPERRIQTACDRCTQGVMDTRNPHANGTCDCDCHWHDDDHGRVWDQWGGLSERDKRRIRRRHPRLAGVLDDITERVAVDLRSTVQSVLSGRTAP